MQLSFVKTKKSYRNTKEKNARENAQQIKQNKIISKTEAEAVLETGADKVVDTMKIQGHTVADTVEETVVETEAETVAQIATEIIAEAVAET